MYDNSQDSWFTLAELELKAVQVPETYSWDNMLYWLLKTADQDDRKTYAQYSLSEKDEVLMGIGHRPPWA
jgi:hypothetical protein